MSEARYCTKSKVCLVIFFWAAAVPGGPCYNWLCSYMAEFFDPYACKCSILEATKSIFSCREMILFHLCRKVKIANYHPRQLFRFIPQISVQRNMVCHGWSHLWVTKQLEHTLLFVVFFCPIQSISGEILTLVTIIYTLPIQSGLWSHVDTNSNPLQSNLD